MKKIIGKWMLASLCIGMIPVALLGASSGGVALAPVALVLSLCVGLFGAAVHSLFFSFREGGKREKAFSLFFAALVVVLVGLQLYADSICRYSEQYAAEQVAAHITQFYKLDMQFLQNPIFSASECSYSFLYDSPNGKYEFVFSKYGEIHTWDFEAYK